MSTSTNTDRDLHSFMNFGTMYLILFDVPFRFGRFGIPLRSTLMHDASKKSSRDFRLGFKKFEL